mmetsp:Transcript_7203/g.19515  ORF Transcript_7203/g.19515 Transcript_7203/m.19515 type:complete len:408 (-) Transcript_7203:126-1349(-)|eukprot:CAMPEP_0198116430 /NCGR_PEP_ID=MMETSP1442-20131203/12276_1 /TAXON_ID= /ORGANISM="Craspedostauros australis, Strain CCMP3328" /LENGTH=407 /DNA_ID=CAMNT_0043774243 /DNA_START=213 /DNA_END=1436 /DNA_ORIENTATION=+
MTRETRQRRRAIWITCINIALHAACSQLQRCLEPFQVEALSRDGDDATLVYGKLQTIFVLIQIIGMPIVRWLLRTVGVRTTNIIVFGSCAISYAIVSNATHLDMLLWSKIPALFQATFLVANATAQALTHDDAHVVLRLMNMAYAVGAVIGPLVGVAFSRISQGDDLYTGARYSMYLSMASVVFSYLFLPNQQQAYDNNSSGGTSLHPRTDITLFQRISNSIRTAMQSKVLPFLLLHACNSLSSSIYSTTLPLIWKQAYLFSEMTHYMAMDRAATALFGAFVMGPLTQRAGCRGVVWLGFVGHLIAWCALAQMKMANWPAVGIGLCTQIVTTGVAMELRQVLDDDQDLQHCLLSAARIVGPIVGTTLLAHQGRVHYVGGVCVGMDALSMLVLALFARRKVKHRVKWE